MGVWPLAATVFRVCMLDRIVQRNGVGRATRQSADPQYCFSP